VNRATAAPSVHQGGSVPAGVPSELLIVDDDPQVIAGVRRSLAALGRVRFATNGIDTLRLAHEVVPDLLLLDIDLPGMSGFEICHAFKSDPHLLDVSIIFLTSADDPEQELHGLELGAVDFITKPPHLPLMQARVRTHLRLQRATRALKEAARIDGLTGVANRRCFDQTLGREWLRTARSQTPLSLLMIDIDDFKAYNDRYGHPAGDSCLREVAQVLASVAHRSTDLLTRYGGEEFALLLPETDAPGAQRVALHLMARVDQAEIQHGHSRASAHVSVSVGVATFTMHDARVPVGDTHLPASFAAATLISSADAALYAAKRAGRHQAWYLATADVEHPGRATPVTPPHDDA
jgi:diguanylate cyclase (GGDEF)-like protein